MRKAITKWCYGVQHFKVLRMKVMTQCVNGIRFYDKKSTFLIEFKSTGQARTEGRTNSSHENVKASISTILINARLHAYFKTTTSIKRPTLCQAKSLRLSFSNLARLFSLYSSIKILLLCSSNCILYTIYKKFFFCKSSSSTKKVVTGQYSAHLLQKNITMYSIRWKLCPRDYALMVYFLWELGSVQRSKRFW